ncbi:MAG TPA: hypothetical protein VM344_02170, partial [Vitreimonas sp.]|nr:hypothetical protein [Vitreimonas sp.]
MQRRVAQGHPPDGPAQRTSEPGDAGSRRLLAVVGGLALGSLALFAYFYGDELAQRAYNHFVWQALAFLDGRAAIDYPAAGNEFFQDVLPVEGPDGAATGRGLIPFPPLPALVLTPFVALWGLDADDQGIAGVLGAVAVVLSWWMLGRLPIGTPARFAGAVFFGFGTVFFYAAQLGTTWYFAHVVAVVLALLAVGLALRLDPSAAADEASGQGGPAAAAAPAGKGLAGLIDGRQLLVGVLFGLACTSRVTMVFAAPLFILVGGGRGWLGRGLSAGLGAALPIAALVLYNVVSTGHLFHPAYEYLYQAEAYGYPTLGYNPSWSIQDPRYIPQNLHIALFSTPVLLPDVYPAGLGGGHPLCVEPGATRRLFEQSCPLALPRDTGMSILLTSPAYLLAVPAVTALFGRSR